MRTALPVLVLLLARVQGHCLDGKRPACGAVSDSGQPSRFVVDHYISDSALKRAWAVVIDCGHPQWPPQIQEVQSAAGGAGLHAPVAVVRAGSRVEVWSEGTMRVRLSGIVLESGSVGQAVKVRAGLGVLPLCGRVRGPKSVELMEGDATCRRDP